MKKILGSLLIAINLFANDYFFKLDVDKNRAYINEPILLNLSFYKNMDLDYITSKFEPKIDNFEVRLLEKRVSGEDEFLITNYIYLLTPKVDGNFTLNLKAMVEEVTASSVEASTIGKNQANLDEALDKTITTTNLTPLNIEVLNNTLSFVGDIKIETKIDSTNIIANNPINFEVIVNFSGDIEKLQDINFTIEGVKIFTDEPKRVFNFYDRVGGTLKQKFALVANSTFTIPKIEFKYLNPKTNRVEIASSKEIIVEVQPNEEIVKRLLDEPKEDKSLEYLKEVLIYLSFTIFGFILCKIIKIPKREKKEISNYQEIENAKSAKELLQLLFKYNKNRDILKLIERVEKIAYSNSKENIKEIKREVIEILKNGHN